MTVATENEIVARIKERSEKDLLGFETSEYLEFLSFEKSKEFLKEGTTKEEWAKYSIKPLTREALLKAMLDYMPFAWDKANNHRGISASRSIAHYVAWTWMVGDKELSAELDEGENYAPYGKPLLVRICEFYGWDSSTWDDNDRSADDE